MCTTAFVFSTLSFSTFIFQYVGVFDVSGGTVSLSSTFTLASFSLASSIFTVCLPQSMPWLSSESLPTVPFTLASCTKSLVLSFTCCKSSWSISTCRLNSGRSFTLTTSFPMSATVSFTCGSESFCFIILKLSMPRSRGNCRCTLSTEICMPVFSEA